MKITLREMFLTLLIVAIALGWWVDRAQFRDDLDFEKAMKNVLVRVNNATIELLLDDGYDCEFTESKFSVCSPAGKGFYLEGYKGPKDIPTKIRIVPYEPAGISN